VQPFDNRAWTVPIAYLFVYLVVGGTLLPYILVINSVRHIGGAGASIMGLTEPPVAAVIAWLVLGSSQALNTIQIIGGAVILAGILVAERSRGAKPGKLMVTPESAEVV
jgi:drug/metabolite transporter (DMT)-like permease